MTTAAPTRRPGQARALAIATALLALLAARATPARESAGREPIVGGPCEGCEAVFEGLPDSIPARARLAPPGEPGERMLLSGRVLDSRGRPRAGVIVYAYHTDHNGRYPAPDVAHGAASRRHGRLRGWAKSAADGSYSFDTIRPVGYPGTTIPQHVHMHVIEPGCSTYYIDDVVFRDDPRLTERELRAMSRNRGGGGIARPERVDGVWRVRRDIRLGLNVPGYRPCDSLRGGS